MSSDYRIVGTSPTTSATLAADDLGAPGAPSMLSILGIQADATGDDEARLTDTSLRAFEVEIILTKQSGFRSHINANFAEGDGTSFLKVAGDQMSGARIATAFGEFNIALNGRNEWSLIQMTLNASSPEEARHRTFEAVDSFLDHVSFMAGVPIIYGQTRVRDIKNDVLAIDVVGPEREATVNAGARQLHSAMRPVYALYREFKNSNSSYYRLLCLYKIMEGVLGPLRAEAKKEALRLGVKLSIPKEKVPNHSDISPSLKYLIGKSAREFFDRTLQKQYRDIVAHFLINGTGVLHVSSAEQKSRFSQMAFVCDLCVRVLIENHEQCLSQLEAARRNSAKPSV